METKKEVFTIGLGFTDVLFFIFLILKLCGVIEWSWLWVCAPLWIPVAILAAIFAVMLIIGAAILIVSGIIVGTYWLYVYISNLITKREVRKYGKVLQQKKSRNLLD